VNGILNAVYHRVGSFVGPLAYVGALVMPAVIYSWQFPHFVALSWNQRDDYARAGYRIMAVDRPEAALRSAWRHSLALTALCVVAPLTGVTSAAFSVVTAPANAYLLFLAARFRRDPDSRSSRALFRYSLLYLPYVLIAMLLTRNVTKRRKASETDQTAHDGTQSTA
jgi:heme o synthase